ncbi:MAG TPA: hypothetical protein ENN13_01050 [Candidatus Altiarchaeales archaeon]|nr:hypothetical protein [Candidatus Altiarchaeales archaeon]
MKKLFILFSCVIALSVFSCGQSHEDNISNCVKTHCDPLHKYCLETQCPPGHACGSWCGQFIYDECVRGCRNVYGHQIDGDIGYCIDTVYFPHALSCIKKCRPLQGGFCESNCFSTARALMCECVADRKTGNGECEDYNYQKLCLMKENCRTHPQDCDCAHFGDYICDMEGAYGGHYFPGNWGCTPRPSGYCGDGVCAESEGGRCYNCFSDCTTCESNLEKLLRAIMRILYGG